jgi:hypothetical protein
MPLTGRDFWEAMVKGGFTSGTWEQCSPNYKMSAELAASALNRIQGALPTVLQTEDAMRAWEAETPREYVLRIYRFLNQSGYTVVGIDAAIEREVRKRKAARVISRPPSMFRTRARLTPALVRGIICPAKVLPELEPQARQSAGRLKEMI